MDDAALERYARLFHERGRLTVNAEREKPFAVEDWDGRTPEQKEIDMRGVSGVVAAVLADSGAGHDCAGEVRRAVAAERERIRQLAIRSHAVCTGDEGTFYFAALIGEPEERAGGKEPGNG